MVLRFYWLRGYWQQPKAVTVLSGAMVCVCASGVYWLTARSLREDAAAELSAAVQIRAATRAPAMAVQPAAGSPLSLPAFSAADLTTHFHAAAAAVKLPVDEVSYVMDNAEAQPFLRYRVTLAVKTGYPEIRKFAAALADELPNAVLDSVRCGRDDIAAAVLSCDLAFSAYYRKALHG